MHKGNKTDNVVTIDKTDIQRQEREPLCRCLSIQIVCIYIFWAKNMVYQGNFVLTSGNILYYKICVLHEKFVVQSVINEVSKTRWGIFEGKLLTTLFPAQQYNVKINRKRRESEYSIVLFSLLNKC